MCMYNVYNYISYIVIPDCPEINNLMYNVYMCVNEFGYVYSVYVQGDYFICPLLKLE